MDNKDKKVILIKRILCD